MSSHYWKDETWKRMRTYVRSVAWGPLLAIPCKQLRGRRRMTACDDHNQPHIVRIRVTINAIVTKD
jgi:hypothetical protein